MRYHFDKVVRFPMLKSKTKAIFSVVKEALLTDWKRDFIDNYETRK